MDMGLVIQSKWIITVACIAEMVQVELPKNYITADGRRIRKDRVLIDDATSEQVGACNQMWMKHRAERREMEQRQHAERVTLRTLLGA
jgi:hypothetical protein